jgi:large subunit ribosomal protein L21
MYAIIQIAGHQYKVSEGGILKVADLDKKPQDIIETDQVLLLAGDNYLEIGQPLVGGAKVSLRVLENLKGEKIRVGRFKAKVRYRRVRGFRPRLSKIKVEKISLPGGKNEISKSSKPARSRKAKPKT